MGICDGRVVIITGAGRGLGREHALAFAAEGAKVVVNDVGASLQGDGNDMSPAQEVVDLIRANGGEAITNGDDIAESSWHVLPGQARRRLLARRIKGWPSS